MATGLKVPNHIAIILDGNGRWAKSKGLPRNAGHVQGAKTVEIICEEAYKMGVQYLTVYAFSTENWNRPKDEVDALMKLLRNYMKNCLKTAEKNNMCVRVIGDKTRLEEDIRKRIDELEKATVNNTGLHFQIALNYGGRDEIVKAVQKIVESGIKPEEIDEKLISNMLYTHDCPDPDFIIRPSGEYRLSNYLIWQSAYSEFWYSDILWPDFKPENLDEAIIAFQQRDRRFGGVKN